VLPGGSGLPLAALPPGGLSLQDGAGALPGLTDAVRSPAEPPAAYAGVALRLMVPAGAPEGAEARAAAVLFGAGFPAPEQRAVSVTISRDHVRFYHSSDAEAAAEAARAIGGDARDFSGMDSPPPPGTVEVWLAGSSREGGTVAAAKPASKPKAAKPRAERAKTPAPSQANQIQALRDRIARQLKATGNP
jgi:hypothetical protein